MTHIKSFCQAAYCFAFGVRLSNIINIGDSQFRSWRLLASICFAVNDLILSIVNVRVIAQIRKCVIACVPVIVTAFHTIKAWTDKGKQNYFVNPNNSYCVIFAKTNVLASVFSCSRFKYFSWQTPCLTNGFGVNNTWQTFNAPKIGCFVQPFVSGHGFPNFLHIVAPSNTPTVKSWQPVGRLVFGS